MKELAPSAEVPATPVPAAPAAQDLAPATLPDWMKELAPSAEVPAAPVPVAPAPQDIAPAELPDWMKELAPSAEAPAAPVPALPAAQDLAPADLPDWMKELAPNAEVPAAPSAEVPPMPPMPVEPAVTPAAAAPVANYDASITAVPAADELPDWLKALTQDEANAAPSADVPAAPAVTPVANYDHVPPASGSVLPMTAAAAADELPDWLKALTQDQPDAAPSAEVPPALVEPAVTPAPGAPVTNFDHVPPASASGLPVTAPAPADELPDWLKDMASDAPVEPAVSSEPVAPITNYDYLPSAPASGFPVTEPAAADELPDWLRAITQSSDAAAAAATTDEPAVETPALAFDAAADAYADAAPDAPASTEPEAAAPITDDEHVPPAPASGLPITPRPTVTLPPWLVGEGTAPFTNEDLPELDDETLAWLSESKKPEPSGLDLAGATLPAEKPAWMDELAAATPAAATLARAAADQSEIAPTPVEEMPDWLRSMRGQAAEETLTTEDTPDWLRTLRGLPPTGQPTPSTTAQPGAAVPAAGKPSPALVPEPVTNYKLPTPAPSVSAGVTETPAAPMPSDLEQVALPAWLSAMRPVEIEQPAEAAEADTYQETLGVLAGMRGVLRAEPAVALPHRAAAPAPALTVSETNTAQANILSELLRSEAVAQPARRGRVRWRALVERWLVFLVLLAAIVLAQFQVQLGLPAIFTTPAPTLPPESAAVYQLIEQLPKDKPALVAFDYDASQSGELDPGAAVVVRQLATRGVPVVAVSLRLTGSGAAEQVLSHSAASGYVNLGYISGGPVGLLQFAVDPRTAFVSDFGGNAKVWQTLPLATVHSLADFGLIVLVSGSPESTRAWLEQAQPYAGDTKTVAVISAGAEPMVRPYYDDPNANSIIGGHLPLKGLIVGLGGAAAYERATYAPAAATALWPALGGGLLAAAVIILLGNLVVLLAAALPRRRKA